MGEREIERGCEAKTKTIVKQKVEKTVPWKGGAKKETQGRERKMTQWRCRKRERKREQSI